MFENQIFKLRTGLAGDIATGQNHCAEVLEDLRSAKTLLENPSFVAKITNVIGVPIQKGFELLPATWSDTVNRTTKLALEKALNFALVTMEDRSGLSSANKLHKIVVAATGAGGGAFGLPALAIELPISTTIMLRSIADIARNHGEQIKQHEVKFECLQVFALGGASTADDAAETGYFAVRSALAVEISAAAQHIMEKGIAIEGAPAIVRFIKMVAARFSVAVSEKAVAQAVPLIGAAGGALVNTLFMDHFQDMARGHFTVRRLERVYGPEHVKEQYEKL